MRIHVVRRCQCGRCHTGCEARPVVVQTQYPCCTVFSFGLRCNHGSREEGWSFALELRTHGREEGWSHLAELSSARIRYVLGSSTIQMCQDTLRVRQTPGGATSSHKSRIRYVLSSSVEMYLHGARDVAAHYYSDAPYCSFFTERSQARTHTRTSHTHFTHTQRRSFAGASEPKGRKSL